jgi:hypothetical protein
VDHRHLRYVRLPLHTDGFSPDHGLNRTREMNVPDLKPFGLRKKCMIAINWLTFTYNRQQADF